MLLMNCDRPILAPDLEITPSKNYNEVSKVTPAMMSTQMMTPYNKCLNNSPTWKQDKHPMTSY